MSSAVHSIARALGGKVVGRNRILCPGPGHSCADRSLSVIFQNERTFVVNSFAGDDFRDCRDLVRAALGLRTWQPDQIFSRHDFHILHDPAAAADEAGRTARALALWNEAVPIAGTPAEHYLAGRGLSYAGEALRWHPSCPFGKKQRLGCMVALVRNIGTDEPQAIHRTALDADARKIDRLSLGPIRGGAVKLTNDADVTLALGLGEGIESSLSVQRLPNLADLPVWAALTAGGIKQFPLLAGIESYWLALDNDPAGRKATQAIAGRLHAVGIEAILIAPRAAGADLNDLKGLRSNA